jgi:branched-chain amino acid aminotransferase
MHEHNARNFTDGAGFVDGHIVPIEDARIPIVDVGFSRSDVTYDVVAVWDGGFFRLDDHLDRFGRSCQALHLELPYSRHEIQDVLMSLVRISGLRESYVEVICTRGVPPAGTRDPRAFENRFYAFAIPYVWILRPDEADRGMDAVITRTVRRIPESSIDPKVKNFHWGDLTRGLYEAYERGGRYPILLDGTGNVTEGAGYNLFALIDGELLTPARGALEGITRRTILELADREGIRATATDISADRFRSATELFATSTAGGVMPVTSVDGVPVGDGMVGPVTAMLRDAYWLAHSDPVYITPVDYGGDGAVMDAPALSSTASPLVRTDHQSQGDAS